MAQSLDRREDKRVLLVVFDEKQVGNFIYCILLTTYVRTIGKTESAKKIKGVFSGLLTLDELFLEQ